jgi:hypothetical protein
MQGVRRRLPPAPWGEARWRRAPHTHLRHRPCKSEVTDAWPCGGYRFRIPRTFVPVRYSCSTGPWRSGFLGFSKAMAIATSVRLTLFALRAFTALPDLAVAVLFFGLSGPQLCRPVARCRPRLQVHRNTSAAGTSSSLVVAAPADSSQARALQSCPPTRPVGW